MSDEVVYVPVPKHWLGPIYSRLAELEGQAGNRTAGAKPDRELIERMYRDSHEQHRRLLRFLASHPDRWYYSRDLAAALQLENGARGLAGMLGAFGRRAKHRYGGRKPWDSEWDSGREEARHRMRPEVASVISALLQGATADE